MGALLWTQVLKCAKPGVNRLACAFTTAGVTSHQSWPSLSDNVNYVSNLRKIGQKLRSLYEFAKQILVWLWPLANKKPTAHTAHAMTLMIRFQRWVAWHESLATAGASAAPTLAQGRLQWHSTWNLLTDWLTCGLTGVIFVTEHQTTPRNLVCSLIDWQTTVQYISLDGIDNNMPTRDVHV